MDYISHTSMDQKEMLEVIGVKDIQKLFSFIPEDVLEKNPLNLDKGLSEIELKRKFKQWEQKNISLENLISFQGAGAYDHYIPSIIEHIVSRSEFYTSYTPYQAELSQGTLQSIYEYQSMICELTAMDIANASLLDGGSAAGEAVTMASRIKEKNNIILSRGIHPQYREIAQTYGKPVNLNFKYLGLDEDYQTNLKKLNKNIDNNTAALVIQYPNFYGSIEKMDKIKNILSQNENNPLFIVIANPLTLGVLKPPGEFEADIVIGEGQPLGNTVNYGGPYLGYMAVKNNRKYLRQMPGRLAGGTTDKNGNKGYVLTLQTREQHIRKEDATSNICTNEALNALIAAIYMAVMGKEGLKEVGNQCLQKAHYLQENIENINDFEVANKNNFFHEFLIKTSKNVNKIIKDFLEKDMIPGVNISRFKEKEGLLVCVTEKRTKKEMDKFISLLEGY